MQNGAHYGTTAQPAQRRPRPERNSAPHLMRAVVVTRYGPPEVLNVREVERPSAGEGDVLIRVHAELRPVIERTYPLDRIVEAHAHADTGRKVGSVVIEL